MTAHNNRIRASTPRPSTPNKLGPKCRCAVEKRAPTPLAHSVRTSSPSASSETSETDSLRNAASLLALSSRPSTPVNSSKILARSKPVRNQHKNGKRRIVEVAQGPSGSEVLFDCTYDTLSKTEQLSQSEFADPVRDPATGKTFYRTKVTKYTTITITTTTVVNHTLAPGDEGFEEARGHAAEKEQAQEMRRMVPEAHQGLHVRVHAKNSNHGPQQQR